MKQRKQFLRIAAAAAMLAAAASFSAAAQGAEEYQDFPGQGPLSGNAVTEAAPKAYGSQPVQGAAADSGSVWEEITVEGVLNIDDDFFPTITKNGTTYLLHANYRYVSALGLKIEDGEQVTVEGVVMPYADDRLGLEDNEKVLRVTKAVVDGETYELGMNTAYGYGRMGAMGSMSSMGAGAIGAAEDAYGMYGRRGAAGPEGFSPKSAGRPSAGGMMYGGKAPMSCGDNYGNSYGYDDRFDRRSDDGSRFDLSSRFSQQMGRNGRHYNDNDQRNNDQRNNGWNGNTGNAGRPGGMGSYCPYYDSDDAGRYRDFQNDADPRGSFSDRNSRGGRW